MQTDSSQQESANEEAETDDELLNSPIARREKEAELKMAQVQS
jgi:hypothetical protein